MPRHFDSVRDALKYRMRHGMSQAALARVTGLHINCIVDCLKHDKLASDKTLEKLGLKRVSYFEQLRPFSTRESVGSRKRKQAESALPGELVKFDTIESKPSALVAKPSTADVITAVRYKVNPLRAWEQYQRVSTGQSFDAFCAALSGAAAKPASAVPVGSALLYGHLKQSEPIPDFRRPIVRGEQPKLEPINQPTVTADS